MEIPKHLQFAEPKPYVLTGQGLEAMKLMNEKVQAPAPRGQGR